MQEVLIFVKCFISAICQIILVNFVLPNLKNLNNILDRELSRWIKVINDKLHFHIDINTPLIHNIKIILLAGYIIEYCIEKKLQKYNAIKDIG